MTAATCYKCGKGHVIIAPALNSTGYVRNGSTATLQKIDNDTYVCTDCKKLPFVARRIRRGNAKPYGGSRRGKTV